MQRAREREREQPFLSAGLRLGRVTISIMADMSHGLTHAPQRGTIITASEVAMKYSFNYLSV